ncbi:MAG TPA: hypothetical protein VME22_13290 [Solirubrobacteraceae bacterium]|nr:hypothetical protein [Solirubrobacteraceae bacterium]
MFATASDRLTSGQIGGAHRLFDVDGGHLCEKALVDLQLGAAVLGRLGPIVVDDPFSVAGPGLTEGILQFLEQRADFEPLILGFNKLVVVPADEREL